MTDIHWTELSKQDKLELLFTKMLDWSIEDIDYQLGEEMYRLDPIAYQVGMNDYESSLREDYENGYGYEELFGDEEE